MPAHPLLHAPEWIEDLSALSPGELRSAEWQLARELEAPQTTANRERKKAALARIRAALGAAAPQRHPGERAGERDAPTGVTPLRPRRISETPRPERALDAMLAILDGWNLDPRDAREIEMAGVPHYTPEEALHILERAAAAGLVGRVLEHVATTREQLQLPLRAA